MRAGAIVSELPLGALPRPLHFPLRNRIISGLSRAVVVVEARRRSGSLITVRHALAQGREVFVVPGAVEGPFAAGTNQLLREGARAIQSARDLLDDLGIEVGSIPAAPCRSGRAGRAAAPQRSAGPAMPLAERIAGAAGRRAPNAGCAARSRRASTRAASRRRCSSSSSPVVSPRSAMADSISVVWRKIESGAGLRYSARHPRTTSSRKKPRCPARSANGKLRPATARSRAEPRPSRRRRRSPLTDLPPNPADPVLVVGGRPRRLRGGLAARAARCRGRALRDEARADVAGARLDGPRRARLQQLAARQHARQRRGPAQGGDAPPRLARPARGGRDRGARRQGPRRRSRRFRAARSPPRSRRIPGSSCARSG